MVSSLDCISIDFPQFSKYIIKALFKRKDYIFEILMNFKDDQIISVFLMISNKIANILENQIDYKPKLITDIYEFLDEILTKFSETLKYEYIIVIILLSLVI